MKTFVLRIVTLAVVVFCLEGCGSSLSEPFKGMKAQNAPLTALRLQNFSPPTTAPATTAAAPQIPSQIQQWIQQGAAMLPPGLIPPGLIPGSTPAQPAPAQNIQKFWDFPIIAGQDVMDTTAKNELFDLFGTESNFVIPRESCMFAEFGLKVPQINQPSADLLVSLSCNQIRTYGFAWPHGQKTGMTPDATKKFVAAMQKVFGG